MNYFYFDLEFPVFVERLCTFLSWLLFTRFFLQDLLNFDDPLNVDAADHFARDRASCHIQIILYLLLYKLSLYSSFFRTRSF